MKGPDAHAQLVSTVATIVTKLFGKDVILTHRCAGINTILVSQYNTDKADIVGNYHIKRLL